MASTSRSSARSLPARRLRENSATTTSAAYVKIEAYYKLLYTQATLKYAHSIDEAIEHEDADEMAEMIGEG